MHTTAFISSRKDFRTALANLRSELKKINLKEIALRSHGILVSGSVEKIEALERLGYRVKLFPDTNILTIGAYRIDISSSTSRIPAKFDVPKTLLKTWQHHLVQLVGPPNIDWIRIIGEQGIEVVEPISRYGLFVVGNPENIRKLKKLSFVSWVGYFKPAYRVSPELRERKGNIRYVNIGFYAPRDIAETKHAIEQAKGTIIKDWGKDSGDKKGYRVLIVEIDAGNLHKIASLPEVRWVEYQSPVFTVSDERACQIVAENLTPGINPIPSLLPAGYQSTLTKLGLSGADVTIGICDTGVCNNIDDDTMHGDLQDRMKFFIDLTGGKTPVDGWLDKDGLVEGGHGTHVAGIAVGNAASGAIESDGFLLGQGVAPKAYFGSINVAAPGGGGTDPIINLTQKLVENGTNIMNNSWHSVDPTAYTDEAALIDQSVRDANPNSASPESLIIVFAAGNKGYQPKTIPQPNQAKNVIVVGSTYTYWPKRDDFADNIRRIAEESGRGPSDDGRILPTVMAPGKSIVSARSTAAFNGKRPLTAFEDPDDGTVNEAYAFDNGTSMATPHVSGVCALIIEWWRKRTNGKTPSPAMVKALLINGAEDLGGEMLRRVYGGEWKQTSPGINHAKALYVVSPLDVLKEGIPLTQVFAESDLVSDKQQWFFDIAAKEIFISTFTPADDIQVRYLQTNIPDNNQGWGRVSLPNMVLQSPDSDRGPKIFSDQKHAFTEDGQTYHIRISQKVKDIPIRITLVWTDVQGAAGSNPALVNDLDLEVAELATPGKIFKGNVFEDGFSVIGGIPDDRNNMECVYIKDPNGIYDVKVVASHLRGNALDPSDMTSVWQDFALVIDNAQVSSDFPVSVVPVIDRSGSMVVFGYENITKISSNLFVDSMSIGDQLGIVSFSTAATVEYPQEPGLKTKTDSTTYDNAKSKIDGISFGGCTYMGDGILKAKNLLGSAGGSKAIVLLSDGYDNKGCDGSNPAKPSALDAAGMLPPELPVYTCAMGPDSDQALLEQIAVNTKGKYYYMPAIDDLFEIYNYIRGQVTGTSIIVNESEMASNSQVGAFVDALTENVSFAVAWANSTIKYVPENPKGLNEVCIQLIDPNGQILNSNISYLQRTEGVGYVIFKIHDPIPGKWFVKISTIDEAPHFAYTVGGFVNSAITLNISISKNKIKRGLPFTIAAKVSERGNVIGGFHGKVRVVSHPMGIPGLLSKYKNDLRKIKVPRSSIDQLPPDIAKLQLLRSRLLKRKGQPDIFNHMVSALQMKDTAVSKLKSMGFANLLKGRAPGPLNSPLSGIHTAALSAKQPGSYNLEITVSGTAPGSGSRFIRKNIISVHIK